MAQKTNSQTWHNTGSFLDWSDDKLRERLSELESEKEDIEFSIRRIENELFYREHPECIDIHLNNTSKIDE